MAINKQLPPEERADRGRRLIKWPSFLNLSQWTTARRCGHHGPELSRIADIKLNRRVHLSMQCTELRSSGWTNSPTLPGPALGLVRGRGFSKDVLFRPPAIARVSVIEVRQVAERACQDISRAETTTQAGR